MIAHIKGRLIHKSFESVIVEVGGVGYEVHIPLSTYYKLPDTQKEVSLNTYTHVREDAIQLYGFLTPDEKEVFQLLIGVSGIGPRLARNILSGISVEDLIDALHREDVTRLKGIPGIGGKTAQRLMVELRDKVGDAWGSRFKVQDSRLKGNGRDEVFKDVFSALVNLGYKAHQAEKAIDVVRQGGHGSSFETILKASLKVLARG